MALTTPRAHGSVACKVRLGGDSEWESGGAKAWGRNQGQDGRGCPGGVGAGQPLALRARKADVRKSLHRGIIIERIVAQIRRIR
jgi:hypothetical protein